MNIHLPQASDLKAFSLLLGRGFLEWKDGRLVHHPGLVGVQPDRPTRARPWDKSDDALLRRMVRKGTTIRQIAKDLQQSASFLERRLAVLREKQPRPHWTTKRLRDVPASKIRAAIRSSGTWTVAGEKLGFRWEAVRDWGRANKVDLGKPRKFKRLATPDRTVRMLHVRMLLNATFSQREIADRLGVTLPTIKRLVNSDEFKRLSRTSSVSPSPPE